MSRDELPIHVQPDALNAWAAAADVVASTLRTAVDRTGVAALALGGVPPAFVACLLASDAPLGRVVLLQTDEEIRDDRTAPNRRSLGALTKKVRRFHPMAIDAHDPAEAARRYEAILAREARAGLDCLVATIGADGRAAGLLPNDPIVAETSRRVGATAPGEGFRRLTLTVPSFDAARVLVWVATGEASAVSVRSVVAADGIVPAGRILNDRATLVVDDDAARLVLPG